MKYGAYQLSDVTAAWVVIECPQCGRRGSYASARLIAEHGADIGLPDLLGAIIQASGCSSHNPTTLHGCKARFAQESVLGWVNPEDPPF